MSSMFILLYGLIPLIVFVILDAFTNLKTAVVGTVVLALVDILVFYFFYNIWDPSLFIAALLFAGLGWVSLKNKNPLMIKMQPALMSVLMAVLLIYFELIGTPLLVRYRPIIEEMAQGRFPPVQFERLVAFLDQTMDWMIVVFVIHAALVAYAAKYRSNVFWLLTRALGFWILAIGAMLLQVFIVGV